MTIEKEARKAEEESTRCSWCNETDDREKVYASPGDDMENPKAFHPDCMKALSIFMILATQNPQRELKDLMEEANYLAGRGPEIKRRRKRTNKSV